MSEKITIKLSVSTHVVGSECTDEFEMDRSEWDAMTKKEKEEFLEESYATHRQNYVEGWVGAYDSEGKCLSDDI